MTIAERLASDELFDLGQHPWQICDSRPGHERGAHAMHGHPVLDRIAARRRHDPRVNAGAAQGERQIAQVQLDAADPRQEPVARERHPHWYVL